MKMLTVKVTYLPLLLLLLLSFDSCESVPESVNESSYQSFYPFRHDGRDAVMTTKYGGWFSMSSPYAIFNTIDRSMYVSVQSDLLKVNDDRVLVCTALPVL